MIRKPVLGLAGALLAGMALTGCQTSKPFTPPQTRSTGTPTASSGVPASGGNSFASRPISSGPAIGGSNQFTPAGSPGASGAGGLSPASGIGGDSQAKFGSTPSSFNINQPSSGSQSLGSRSPAGMSNPPGTGLSSGAGTSGTPSSFAPPSGGALSPGGGASGPRDDFPMPGAAPAGGIQPPSPPGRLTTYQDAGSPSSSSSVPQMPTPGYPPRQ